MSIFEGVNNSHHNLFQKENGLILLKNGCSAALIQLLHSYGLCVSYATSNRSAKEYASHIRKLVPQIYNPFRQVWALDNVELYRSTFQKSSSNQNSLESKTLRAFVPVTIDNHLLSSTTPRIALKDIKLSDIVASSSDNQWFRNFSSSLIRDYIIKNIPGFEKFSLSKPHPNRPHSRLDLIPLSVMDEREMETGGMIKILDQFCLDFYVGDVDGLEQLVIGDGGTVKSMNSAVRERKHDHLGSAAERLEHIRTGHGPFHFHMALQRSIRLRFGWDTNTLGTLGYFGHKKNVNINGNKFKYYEMHDIMQDYFNGLLSEACMLAMNEIRFGSAAAATEDHINDIVSIILQNLDNAIYVIKRSTNSSLKTQGRERELTPQIENIFENYKAQFMKDFFLYQSHKSCVRHGDGDGLQRVHRLALPLLKQYSTTYCSLVTRELIELETKHSARCAYISIQNRFCNTNGKHNSFTAMDWAFERYVMKYKAFQKGTGSNINDGYCEVVSLVAPVMDEVQENMVNGLGLSNSGSHYHKKLDTSHDMKALLNDLNTLAQQINFTQEQCKAFAVPSVVEAGYHALISKGYLDAQIQKARGAISVDDGGDSGLFEYDEEGERVINLTGE
ncbi:hypothetical protein BDR26DRAFT_992904 [Obelidium mucronatum]|nr:hypothetical protein BDR26DRAFT_992904 [Obelidium mucronatum]